MSAETIEKTDKREEIEVMTIDPIPQNNHKSPLLTSWRFWTIILAMACTVQLMMVRMSLSMALVCMVTPKHTINNSSNNTIATRGSDSICAHETESTNLILEQKHIGAFNWSKTTQGHILCSYFYGYILGIYSGGIATDRWGGRIFILTSVGTMALTNMLIPVAATTHHHALYAIRVVQGLAEALGLNAHQYLLTRWGTQRDISLLTGISYAGFPLGVMLVHPLVSSLCLHGPWGGWRSVFYLLGGLGAVWTVLAAVFLHNSPSSHPFISPAEIQYFRRYSPAYFVKKRGRLQWRELVKSGPVWALIGTSAFGSFGYFVFTLHQPLFLRDVFGLSLEQNGVVSSLLWVLELPVSLGVGLVVDALRRKHISITITKKVCNTTGLILAGITPVIVVEADCGWRGLAAAALALVVVGNCVSFVGGYYYTPIDLAPFNAATLSGLASTFIGLNGFITPIIVAWLTPNGTRSEWRGVFWLSGIMYLIGALIFLVWGSADPLPWAMTSHDKHRLGPLEGHDGGMMAAETHFIERNGEVTQNIATNTV